MSVKPMRCHCILSHGFESGPDATKVTVLSEVAERLGWTSERPDYIDLDAQTNISPLGNIPARLERLRQKVEVAVTQYDKVVLAGSSLGSYISGQVSAKFAIQGLFLMVPPIAIGSLPHLEVGAQPLYVLHAWNDELIPVADVVQWSQTHSARLLLVNDTHRLMDHVDTAAEMFADLLKSV